MGICRSSLGIVRRTVSKLMAGADLITHDMICARTVRWSCRSRMGMVQRTVSNLRGRTDDLMTCNVPGP